ncbi:MAG: hypothetical protein L0226_18205 [Acidobacteria bacterium]|nr:hypothetical protein [Acidobacteriota bacterium]
MPTVTYSDTAFWPLNLGLSCINLDLSTGDNKFDLSRLDNTKDICGAIPAEIRNKIHALLDPITITISDFDVPGGKVRLNHLGKSSAVLSWSAAHGGSILLAVEFESAGTELLGTYHGQINEGKLFIYLAVSVSATGQLVVTPQTDFSANINIVGLADFLERPLRTRIRRQIAEETREELGPYAQDLAEVAITNLSEGDKQVPPDDAFYTQVTITNGQATITWAESLVHGEIIVDGVEPEFSGPEERLILRLSGGALGSAGLTVSRSASPNKPIVLPLKLSGIPLPDGKPLNVRISMDAIDLTIPQNPKGRTVGKIDRTFSSPGYGSGSHSESDGDLTVNYKITVA